MSHDKFPIQFFFFFLFQIAMGQGQADLAIHTLKECARNGEWLCLKNLHLVIPWLPVLEKVIVARQECFGNKTKLGGNFETIMHFHGDA